MGALRPTDAVVELSREISHSRVRFSEFFRDFDPLRSGTCVQSALKAVLTQLNIKLKPDVVDSITSAYLCGPPQRLDYRSLIRDVEAKMATSLDAEVCREAAAVAGDNKSAQRTPTRTHWTNGEISIVRMLQAQVYEKRVGFRDHFRDFDHLQKGFITEAKLRCVLTILNFDVTDEEIDELVRLYGIGNNELDYRRLCDDVERDLVCGRLEADPDGVPPEPFDLFSAKEGKKAILSQEELDAILQVEGRIRSRTKQHRINFLPHFRSFDHYNRLVITGNQFNRAMNTLGFELSVHDLNVLQKKYCVHGSPARFAYRDFCASIEDTM